MNQSASSAQFGDKTMEEDKTVRLTIELDESKRRAFKSLVAGRGQTMKEAILEYIEESVASDGSEESVD